MSGRVVRDYIWILIPLFIILCCIIPIVHAAAPTGEPPTGSGPLPLIDAFYFYGDGCIHCANIKPHLADLESRYPGLKLNRFEVYHNATNRELFTRLTAAYGVKVAGVPTLLIGDSVLVGEDQIRDGAEPRILALIQAGTPVIPTPSVTVTGGEGNCPSTGSDLTLPLVISCALIDSVNPCAFAVLVFLLLSIITLESRRRVLMVGAAYIAAVFVFYLLSGIGLFAVVQRSGFSQLLFVGAAVLSIILGLVNILDVIRKNEGFILAIPASKKELIERYTGIASLPAAFVLGVLVGIFELPCTGGIYLAILSMMSRTFTFSTGIPYLILYNFIFVLPLIVILLVVSFGLSPERVNSWRLEKRRLLRLAIGIVMVAIGAVMLSGWL